MEMRDILRNVRHYSPSDLRADMTAGLTVAVLGIPQAMAYAMIAGLSPIFGLYTAVVSCIVASMLGSSSHLVTGPTNAMSLVVFSLSAPYINQGNHLEVILLLTLMTGAIQLAMGLLRMGGVMRYVSNSVVVGFTAGVGILIAANQVFNVMGVTIAPEEASRFYSLVIATVREIPESNIYSLIVGLFTIFVVLGAPRIHRRLPGPLLAVLLSALLVSWLGWDERGVQTVRDIAGGSVERGFSLLHFPRLLWPPDLKMMSDLSGGAVALAILGLVESGSIARSVASSSGQRLDFSREFTAQGAGNMAGAFFSCYPASGSFTRTAVCHQSGGRTRMGPIFSAGWIALTIMLFAPLANFIPKASLAGMLIVIAYSMVEKHRLGLAWRSGMNSRAVFFGTLVSTLIFPLEYAIFVGIFLSVFFLLKITGKTDLTQLVPRPDGGFDEIPFNRAAPSPVVTVNMEGDFYFAAVEDLDYELERALTPVTRVVVLRMKRLRAVGSTAMAILEHFWSMLQDRGICLVVCGIEPHLIDVLTRSGLRRRIGEANIFFADNKIFQSTELAMARAWSVVEMERRREDLPTPNKDLAPILSAKDLMSRQCVRFGYQHQLREAIWLLSEMNRRQQNSNAQMLYLQDTEGRLAGGLSIWDLLEEVLKGADLNDLRGASPEALGEALRRNHTTVIASIAERDLPVCSPQTPLAEMLGKYVNRAVSVIPVCDDGGRVVGLVSEDDLLGGISKLLDSASGGGGAGE